MSDFGDDSPVYVPLEPQEAVKLNITLNNESKIVVINMGEGVYDSVTGVYDSVTFVKVLVDNEEKISNLKADETSESDGILFTYVGSVSMETNTTTTAASTTAPVATTAAPVATTAAPVATTVAPAQAPAPAPAQAPAPSPAPRVSGRFSIYVKNEI